jgi:hypothetical protein
LSVRDTTPPSTIPNKTFGSTVLGPSSPHFF